MECCALIMAGGHGTRFWPWSSELLPKQFLPIAHTDRSLLQQTYRRVKKLADPARILVLTNQEYTAIVRTQLPELPLENVIGEPLLRDTAAAVGLGTILAAKRWPDAIQIILPADHDISPESRFREVVLAAAEAAKQDRRLYTIGIRPTRPSSAYGYLKRGEKLEAQEGIVRAQVDAFVEKPDVHTARQYLKSGNYYWNAGMFIWRADAARDAFARRLPEHARLLPEVLETFTVPDFDKRLHDVFLRLPRISVDYGVMQAEGEAGNVRTVEGDFNWSDLGGWQAFSETLQADTHNNRVYGNGFDWNGNDWQNQCQPREQRKDDKDEDLTLGDVLTMESNNNLVFNNRRGHRIALFGVDDLAVVHTHAVTLITTREKAEAIKPLVNAMPPEEKSGGMIKPQKVTKPWGWELWWGWSDDFAGKTLFLKAGKRFSKQYHVVKEEVIYLHQGTAKLTTAARGEELTTIEMQAGDAVHVEPGRIHRIEAVTDCLLFESSTPFLWDVVRMSDDFGREGTRQAEIDTQED